MTVGQTVSAADGLRAAVDDLLAVQPGQLASAEVAALLSEIETQRRRLQAVDQQLVAEISQRGIAGEYGRTGPADLLVQLLRVSPREAKARSGGRSIWGRGAH